MNPDPSILVGLLLYGIEKTDHTWFFTFTETIRIATEGVWRLVTTEGIEVTSEDHGHQFGLPAPVDAVDRVMSQLHISPVSSVRIDRATGDLFVYFNDGVFLQFLQTSGGYECWRLRMDTHELVCTGSGLLSMYRTHIEGQQIYYPIWVGRSDDERQWTESV